MPTYTANWFPADVFVKFCPGLKGKQNLRFLEIGVFEGQGTRFFFEKLLGTTGTLVGIDPFIEYSKSTVAKIQGFDHLMNGSTEERFRSNTAEFASRMTIHKGLSQNVLPGLPSDSFDLSFVDGDHSRDAVAFDALHSMRLVKRGGYIVFDDYGWGYKDRPETCPKPAIDKFLMQYSKQINVLFKQWCVVVQKK